MIFRKTIIIGDAEGAITKHPLGLRRAIDYQLAKVRKQMYDEMWAWVLQQPRPFSLADLDLDKKNGW